MLRHHFTVDVEEYFQVAAFERVVSRRDWNTFPSRVMEPTLEIVDLLSAYGSQATFFFLGCVAQRWPDLVKRVASEGHEVASHGWEHARVDTLEPDAFRADVRRAKAELEQLTGRPVPGYRAPSFSITPERGWALDILIEEGHTYDASCCPGARLDGNGSGTSHHAPHWVLRPSGRIAEYPALTLNRFGVRVPAGGGYFRILPYGLTRTALLDSARRGVPGTFYLHPWELDVSQPRLDAPWVSRIRHYTGLHRTRSRLERLLAEFKFARVCDTPLPA